MHVRRRHGFTLVEILMIITILSILFGVVVYGLGSWQRRQATTAVQSDLRLAVSGLHTYRNFEGNFPPNLAGTGFASSQSVSVTLRTNAPSVGVYEGLNGSQNAQLFLNACNANVFATPNNTACSFQGNGGGAKIHVKGTTGSNAIWDDPIDQADLVLSCGSEQAACDQVLSDLVAQFTAQGGVFPILVPGNSVPLPEPTLVANGPASRYCIEGRASDYPDIVYYALSETSTVTAGECPVDPSLQYYN